MASRFGHLTVSDLHSYWLQWQQSNKIERFGQFLFNRTVHDGEPWPDLFYCRDPEIAYSMAMEHIQYDGE